MALKEVVLVGCQKFNSSGRFSLRNSYHALSVTPIQNLIAAESS